MIYYNINRILLKKNKVKNLIVIQSQEKKKQRKLDCQLFILCQKCFCLKKKFFNKMQTVNIIFKSWKNKIYCLLKNEI